MELKDKVSKVVKQYMDRVRNAEFLGEVNDFILFEEEDEVVVFVKPSYEIGKFPNPRRDRMRKDFEEAMIIWFSEPENRDKADFPLRCDSFEINVLNEDRALVRHVVNVFGNGDGYHDWH